MDVTLYRSGWQHLLHADMTSTAPPSTVTAAGSLRRSLSSVWITATVALLLWSPVGRTGVGAATSDFYYNHWQCNNYLSGETIVVKAPPGKLMELHIRDNIAVSRLVLPSTNVGRNNLVVLGWFLILLHHILVDIVPPAPYL